MAARSNPRRLIVEGYEDLQSVAALMGAHIAWPQDKKQAPVWIEIANGADEILRDGYLSVELKNRETRTLGIIFDADTKPSARYERVRLLCGQFFEGLPAELPQHGLISESADGKRLGVWVMPDNRSQGDLETFLKHLVPDSSAPIWKHALESVQKAKGMGCPCRDGHVTKANLYTWLAWQDPPGQSPGRALTKKILDPQSGRAAGFVRWFRNLYQL